MPSASATDDKTDESPDDPTPNSTPVYLHRDRAGNPFCSFGVPFTTVDRLDAPDAGSAVEFAETAVLTELDDAEIKAVPTEPDREDERWARDDPLRVGTLTYDDQQVISVDVDVQRPRTDGGAITDPGQPGDPPTPTDDLQWRLRFQVDTLTHYTAWTEDFPTVENLAEQYRRDDHFQNVVIERRASIDGRLATDGGTIAQPAGEPPRTTGDPTWTCAGCETTQAGAPAYVSDDPIRKFCSKGCYERVTGEPAPGASGVSGP